MKSKLAKTINSECWMKNELELVGQTRKDGANIIDEIWINNEWATN